MNGLDLEVPAHSFTVLVGPSGCGKSTLLRAIAGLETVDSGTVTLGGRDVTAMPPGARDVAMVFQSYALYPHLTVAQNLEFGLRIRKLGNREIATRVQEIASMLGLEALLGRYPKELSGGQRQRVAMGRALVRRAQLYLFDEPLSNLDAALRAEVRVEIRRLHDRIGATSVYVTHDQVEAMTLADTLWVLRAGRVEQRGAPLDVYHRPKSVFVASFLGSPTMNLLEGVVAAGGDAIDVGGASFVLRGAYAGLVPGRSVTFGVRPADVDAVSEGKGSLHIDVVEALGSETFAHGTLAGSTSRFTVRLHGHQKVRAGDRIPVNPRDGAVHVFDAATGLSLAVDP